MTYSPYFTGPCPPGLHTFEFGSEVCTGCTRPLDDPRQEVRPLTEWFNLVDLAQSRRDDGR